MQLFAHTVWLLAAVPSTLGLLLPDDVGRVPALGWNSWNVYHCDINESRILEAAQYIVDKGFKNAGYKYVNIDDCWSVMSGRDNTTQQIIPDPAKFPQGIKGTADKIHAMGLKIGIYSSASTKTCGGYPASLGYEEIDAESFAAWRIDYLKYDNCNAPSNWTDECRSCYPDGLYGFDNVTGIFNGSCTIPDGLCPGYNLNYPVYGHEYNYSTTLTAERYRRMRDALEKQNRTILFSMCEWGEQEVWTWGNQTGSSWRVTDDMPPYWDRIVEILNEVSFLTHYGNFYGHNDPDILEVGNGNLTDAEIRSHFALWTMVKAPLLISTDLATISQSNIDVLQNKYLLAFHQDKQYGEGAGPYKWGINPDWSFNATSPAEYWSGASSNGTFVAMLKTQNNTESRTMRAEWREVPGLQAGGKYKVTNAWTGDSLGCRKGGVQMDVGAHDTAVLVLQEGCGSKIGSGKHHGGHGRPGKYPPS